jgi:hypothetical protein
VVHIRKLNRALAALALSSTAMLAQSAFEPTFKLAFGKVTGDFAKVTGAKTDLGIDFELAYRLDKAQSIVGSLGYRFNPGENQLVSYYRIAAATPLYGTGVNPTYFEQRERKTDVQGFQLIGLYRYDLADLGLYLQGGLRVGFNQTKVFDTGTTLTTNGNAATTQTSANILRVDAISIERDKKSTAVGGQIGVGYRVENRYNFELNVFSTKASNPDLSSNAVNAASYKSSFSGIGAELTFGIRF